MHCSNYSSTQEGQRDLLTKQRVYGRFTLIADRVLNREVQQPVSCMNAAISTFVDGLLEAEAARTARLM